MRLIHVCISIYRRLPSARLKRLIMWGWEHFGPKLPRVIPRVSRGSPYELHLDELIDHSICYYGCFEAATAG